MAILLTGNEGEFAPFTSGLATARADVNKRGAILVTGQWNRLFTLPSDKPRLSVSAHYIKVNINTINATLEDTSQYCLRIADSTNKTIAQIRAKKVPSPVSFWTLCLDTYNGAGVWTPEIQSYGTIPVDMRLDLVVDYNTTTDIVTVGAYMTGILCGPKVSFDAVTAAVGQPRMGGWGRPNIGTGLAGNADYQFWVHDLILADDSTVGVSLTTLQGSSGGFYTAADGTYVSISGLGVDTTTGLVFYNVGDKESWIVTPLVGKDYTGSAIGAFVTTFLAAAAPASAIKAFRPFMRIGGTDYYVGASIPAEPEMKPYTVSVPVNPATGLGFTGAQVTAGLEFGLEAMAA